MGYSIFNSDINLQNQIAKLKPFSMDDFGGFSKIAMDKKIWEYTTPFIESNDDLKKYMDDVLALKASGERYPFTIIDVCTNQIAGSTSFLNISEKNKCIEIGATWIGREFQRTGLNKACKYLLADYVFNVLNFERLEFKTDSKNISSRKALFNIGAKEEGILRSHMVMNFGRRRDSVFYSILKNEWESVKKKHFTSFN